MTAGQLSSMIETVSESGLTKTLRERITTTGPITFFEWMQAALYDPQYGYYCRADRKKWGRLGDYRTSPERSSLFGATFARYFATLYEKLGHPSSFTILELGAGDGSFAVSVLQTLEEYYPDVFLRTRYLIDEPGFQSQQTARKRLLAFSDRVAFERPSEAETGVVFSNEVLDAFPVHRVAMAEGRLHEFYVDLGPNAEFVWTLGEPSSSVLAQYLDQQGVKLGEGQIVEVNLEIEEWLKALAAGLRHGYVVTVDYGAESNDLYPTNSSDPRYRGTLRSFQRHQLMDDVLSNPGEQDLTTTVNWTAVKRSGERLGLSVVEFERQDKFLLTAGLLDQLEKESGKARTEADKLRLSSAALEMILPTGMSASFQVLVQKKN